MTAEEPLVTSRANLEHCLAHAGIAWEDARIDRPVLLALPPIHARLEESGALAPSGHPYFRDMAEAGGLLVARARIASPAIALQAAELCDLGATALVHLGFAGAIDPALEVGAAVVTIGAINETGTGLIYGHDLEAVVPADADLARRLAERLDATARPTWCTDAPLRETRAKVERYRALGAVCVEMEAAGLLAVAAEHGVPASAVYLISDRLTEGGWEQAWFRPELASAIGRLVEALPRIQAAIAP